MKSRFLLAALLLFSSLAFMAGCARSSTSVRRTLQSATVNTAPQAWPVIVADYQPWFGDPKHIDVGYSSQDPAVLRGQIDKARQMGIAAFIVNWYGQSHPFEDRSHALLQKIASETGFKVALMYDEPADPTIATERTISDLQYAYQHYIGPDAPYRDAYLTFNGRPLLFIFPKAGRTDWAQVRQAVSDWQQPPLIIYKDLDNQRYAQYFDGFYAWVNTDTKWKHRDDWGKQYLERFYTAMQTKYPDKIAVGAAWPGFDDRRASWTLNRVMNQRCGQTFEDSLRLFHKFYTDSNPLPFLMIDTWNDYEEGTAIERGLQPCDGSTEERAESHGGSAAQQ